MQQPLSQDRQCLGQLLCAAQYARFWADGVVAQYVIRARSLCGCKHNNRSSRVGGCAVFPAISLLCSFARASRSPIFFSVSFCRYLGKFATKGNVSLRSSQSGSLTRQSGWQSGSVLIPTYICYGMRHLLKIAIVLYRANSMPKWFERKMYASPLLLEGTYHQYLEIKNQVQ